MSLWVLVQIFVNLCFLLAIFVVWLRLKRPPQDDPRLSRGLQLLQSKISVLEDLSDRTEIQVKQLNALLDEKANQMRKSVLNADDSILQIQQAMQKSLKVAEIFQDRIPHAEIIERQNTVKYVTAARMAHEGQSVEEIAAAVDLPIAELQFITKVNKDQLMFKEDLLPSWAMNSGQFENTEEDRESLDKISQNFRQAVESFERKELERTQEEELANQPSPLAQATKKVTQQVAHKIKERTEELVEAATMSAKQFTEEVYKKNFKTPEDETAFETEASFKSSATTAPQETKAATTSKVSTTVKVNNEPIIKKVQFPRIDVTKNLG